MCSRKLLLAVWILRSWARLLWFHSDNDPDTNDRDDFNKPSADGHRDSDAVESVWW